MNYLSVCSGIEAATVAWHHMGWKPVGFSEIEKFPSQVLAHHYPQVTNFGDMTKYKEWEIDRTIGLLVGGTPCQSFSVAGLRKGLSDPRGNLALTYVGILDHFRPKWFIWENVPGVLSSNQGRDFASFLTALGIIGYGWSYRVLDAQYFGVAQRRRRVFVVGHLGDWRPTAEVLFESDCLRRDTKKGRRKGEETPRSFIPSIANTLQTTCHEWSRADGFNMIAYENHPSDSRVKEMGDVCQTVTSTWGSGGGNIPFVQNIAYEWHNQDSRIKPIQVAATLNCNASGREGHLVQSLPIALAENTIGRQPIPEYYAHQYCQDRVYSTEGITPALNCSQSHKFRFDMAVRRLTPVECERLQGFPDNYTNIKEKCPDGARYKALGNSMAVPVMRWIGERINSYETMRSSAVVQVETGVGLAKV